MLHWFKIAPGLPFGAAQLLRPLLSAPCRRRKKTPALGLVSWVSANLSLFLLKKVKAEIVRLRKNYSKGLDWSRDFRLEAL
jgi:hypothetical protein